MAKVTLPLDIYALMSSHQFSSQVLMDFLQYWFGEFYNFKLEHYSRKIMEIMEDLPWSSSFKKKSNSGHVIIAKHLPAMLLNTVVILKNML